ncbi:MAG: glycosyltransferase [Anaerolineales bacterium]|nr:glycosyltransferase [Anaerolineales bacterium]
MYNQVKYLPETIEIHVVCERTENLDQFAGPNIHSLRSISRLRYFFEKGLRKFRVKHLVPLLLSTIREAGAQLVHSHFGDVGWVNMDSVKRAGANHIVTFYGYDVNMLPSQNTKWRTRYAELFCEAHAFLCEGPHMARQLINLGCPQEKIRVHRLGVAIESIPYLPRRWREGKTLRVLMAASFTEKKGLPYAIRALSELQYILPIEITIIGDANPLKHNQREKKHILELIERNGLKSKTRLLGYQPHAVFLAEAYRHHIFVSPSVTASNGDTEGGAPVTLIEMMASGIPVISTAHCDIPEVVQYGIDNWLVEERNVSGLVAKLRWLIENPDRWDAMLRIGRNHVEKEFNALDQGMKLAEIYEHLLSQRKGIGR